jgi:hypothetical protein
MSKEFYKENTYLYQRFGWGATYYFKQVIKFLNRDAVMVTLIFLFGVVGLLLQFGIIPDMARSFQ